MSNSSTELFESVCRIETSEDIVPVSFMTLVRFFIAICRVVSDREIGISLVMLVELVKEVILAMKNREAARMRKGVYLLEGLVYIDGMLLESLKGRYLETVIHIIQCGPTTIAELKMRFWLQNTDENEASDRSVSDAINHINRKIEEYGIWISAESGKYGIFSNTQKNTQLA